MSSPLPGDGNANASDAPASDPSQPDDSSAQNQVFYSSDTSSLRLPQDSAASSFRGITFSDRDDTSRYSDNSQRSVAGIQTHLRIICDSDSSEKNLLDSLAFLSRQVNWLNDEEIDKAWQHFDIVGTGGGRKGTESNIVMGAGLKFYSEICVRYQADHARILHWLFTEIGDPAPSIEAPSSHIPRRLYVFTDHPEPQIDDYQHSLLPLLATLIHDWHKAAESARKRDDRDRKTAKSGRLSSSTHQKSSVLTEEQDIQKLFKYTVSYVKLQKTHFQEDNSDMLAESLVNVCKSATTRVHIENAMEILEAFQSKASLTHKGATGILQVLCAIVAQIPPLSLRARALIASYATGVNGLSTTDTLLTLIDELGSGSSAKSIDIYIAQGALVTINELFSESKIPEERNDNSMSPPVILASCARASATGHGKINVHILLLLASLLKKASIPYPGNRAWSGRFRQLEKTEDLWAMVLQILRNCVGNDAAEDLVSEPKKQDSADDKATYSILVQLVRNEKVVSPDDKKDPMYKLFNTADRLKAAIKVHNRIEKEFSNLTGAQYDRFVEYFLTLQDKITTLSSKLLVRIFLRSMTTEPKLAYICYIKFLRTLTIDELPSQHRLNSLRLLCRLRCDTSSHVWVTADPESEHVAVALYRTKDTALTSNDTQAQTKTDTFPLWMYPGPNGLPDDPPTQPSALLFVNSHSAMAAPYEGDIRLDLTLWLENAIQCINAKDDWEVYSYIAVHLGAQVANMQLFDGAGPAIKILRNRIVEIIHNEAYMEPPKSSGLRKSNVATCFFNILTMLVPYHAIFSKDEQERMVHCFVRELEKSSETTAQTCIHALTVCCLEIPGPFNRYLGQILNGLQKIITRPQLSMHVLEFLGGFARNPELRRSVQSDTIRGIFGICIQYLKIARESKAKNAGRSRLSHTQAQHTTVTRPEDHAMTDRADAAKDFPDYVFALTFHVMNFWFLSLKLQDRANHVKWLVRGLVFSDAENNHFIEEQSQVFIDMMQRTTYSDLGETYADPTFADESDGPVSSKSWLVGHSIVTIQTAGRTGKSQITKRQASGTTHATYQQHTADTPEHHIPIQTEVLPESAGAFSQVAMLPSHILLLQISTAAGIESSVQPIALPETTATQRALRLFDVNQTVDSHGIGLIYVGPGQSQEHEILGNTSSSADFDQFLASIGTKVALEGAKFVTHGLDPATNGAHTYAWRDRLNELVFHIPSIMPDLETDPQHNEKKRTIGNDLVKIIFNNSGLPYKFDTISTQFDYVNIIITPATVDDTTEIEHPFADPFADPGPSSSTLTTALQKSQKTTPQKSLSTSFYKIQTITNPTIPSISPTSSFKVISGSNLAIFVRQIALNASVFSLVWQNRSPEDPNASQYTSRWRNRLQAIKRLRSQVVTDMNNKADAEEAAAASERAGGTGMFGLGGGRKSVQPATSAGVYPEDREAGAAAVRPVVDLDSVYAGGNLADYLDFSRWSS